MSLPGLRGKIVDLGQVLHRSAFVGVRQLDPHPQLLLKTQKLHNGEESKGKCMSANANSKYTFHNSKQADRCKNEIGPATMATLQAHLACTEEMHRSIAETIVDANSQTARRLCKCAALLIFSKGSST